MLKLSKCFFIRKIDECLFNSYFKLSLFFFLYISILIAFGIYWIKILIQKQFFLFVINILTREGGIIP